MKNFLKIVAVLISGISNAQYFQNMDQLNPFFEKLKVNNQVTNILFLGDSHIQAGWTTNLLKNKFQEKFGNAGRGIVFPYQVANSNGPFDYTSVSNQPWVTFRLSYQQDRFSQMGAAGFVMGNQKDSFIQINISNPEDAFDEVKIFNDDKMSGESFSIFESNKNLNNFANKKKNLLTYTVGEDENFYELAAKFNTTTTRLAQLNGNAVKSPKPGQIIKAEQVDIDYNPEFEKDIIKIGNAKYQNLVTTFTYPKPTQELLIKTNASQGNQLYGFQLLKKNMKSGVVFNSVGVNGATFGDYMRFSLQVNQLLTTNPDVVMIALGTNESLSSLTKEDFQNQVKNLVEALRKTNKNLPILLISPTDNRLKPAKIKEIVSWIEEAAILNNTAFINLYTALGGSGYFAKALSKKEANTDGVHFLKSGYEAQANKIWELLSPQFQ